MMPKPNRAAIRAAVPLSQLPTRGDDPILACNVCGMPAESMSVWREHDERDKPIDGDAALVFVGSDSIHAACRKRLDAHPRLYSEVMGKPGHFPGLCGPCTHRNGFNCRHPDLTANGGAGLLVNLSGGLPKGVVCLLGARGPIRPLQRAIECKGLVPK